MLLTEEFIGICCLSLSTRMAVLPEYMQPYMALNYMIKVGVIGDELANLEAEIESAIAIDSLAANFSVEIDSVVGVDGR